MSYVGKLVFLESTDKDHRYRNGEYFCLRESPHILYCIKPVAGYDSHELKSFPLIGADKYDVISVEDVDRSFLDDLIGDMREFVATREDRRWIESVYEGEAQVLKMVEKLRPTKITHEENINGKKVKVTIEINE